MAKDWVKNNTNLFWESAFSYWLKPKLTQVYQNPRWNRKLRKWLKDKDFIIKFQAEDMYMDPAFLILSPEGFEILIGDREEENLSVRGEKVWLILGGTKFSSLLHGLLTFKLRIELKNVTIRDLLYLVQLFYF